MRVLLIEDDAVAAQTVQLALKSEGIICDIATIGEEGVEIGKHYDYDLIILDLLLPDMDGYEVLRHLRSIQIGTPVLILSGLGETEDKIKGLGIGADDYLTKPYNKSELIARIRAIIRRSKGHSQSIIQIGRLTLNLTTQIVKVDDQVLRLTGREYAILELMAVRRGSTLSKEVFLNHLYGGVEEPEFKIIDVFICKLRKKLSEAMRGESYIETVWGRGYVLRDPSSDNSYISGTIPRSSKVAAIPLKEKKRAAISA